MTKYSTILTLNPTQYTLFDDHFTTHQPLPDHILQILQSSHLNNITFNIDQNQNLHIQIQTQ